MAAMTFMPGTKKLMQKKGLLPEDPKPRTLGETLDETLEEIEATIATMKKKQRKRRKAARK